MEISKCLPKSYLDEVTNGGNICRKISHIKDPEGKLRPIAILDYWSQSCLKPIHEYLFRLLDSFSQDCTFKQNKAKMGSENFCFDLTAATDRFPLEIQRNVISNIFRINGYKNHEEKALAWSNIMVKHAFMTPEGDQIFYKTGQPMGAYSS